MAAVDGLPLISSLISQAVFATYELLESGFRSRLNGLRFRRHHERDYVWITLDHGWCDPLRIRRRLRRFCRTVAGQNLRGKICGKDARCRRRDRSASREISA